MFEKQIDFLKEAYKPRSQFAQAQLDEALKRKPAQKKLLMKNQLNIETKTSNFMQSAQYFRIGEKKRDISGSVERSDGANTEKEKEEKINENEKIEERRNLRETGILFQKKKESWNSKDEEKDEVNINQGKIKKEEVKEEKTLEKKKQEKNENKNMETKGHEKNEPETVEITEQEKNTNQKVETKEQEKNENKKRLETKEHEKNDNNKMETKQEKTVKKKEQEKKEKKKAETKGQEKNEPKTVETKKQERNANHKVETKEQEKNPNKKVESKGHEEKDNKKMETKQEKTVEKKEQEKNEKKKVETKGPEKNEPKTVETKGHEKNENQKVETKEHDKKVETKEQEKNDNKMMETKQEKNVETKEHEKNENNKVETKEQEKNEHKMVETKEHEKNEHKTVETKEHEKNENKKVETKEQEKNEPKTVETKEKKKNESKTVERMEQEKIEPQVIKREEEIEKREENYRKTSENENPKNEPKVIKKEGQWKSEIEETEENNRKKSENRKYIENATTEFKLGEKWKIQKQNSPKIKIHENSENFEIFENQEILKKKFENKKKIEFSQKLENLEISKKIKDVKKIDDSKQFENVEKNQLENSEIAKKLENVEILKKKLENLEISKKKIEDFEILKNSENFKISDSKKLEIFKKLENSNKLENSENPEISKNLENPSKIPNNLEESKQSVDSDENKNSHENSSDSSNSTPAKAKELLKQSYMNCKKYQQPLLENPSEREQSLKPPLIIARHLINEPIKFEKNERVPISPFIQSESIPMKIMEKSFYSRNFPNDKNINDKNDKNDNENINNNMEYRIEIMPESSMNFINETQMKTDREFLFLENLPEIPSKLSLIRLNTNQGGLIETIPSIMINNEVPLKNENNSNPSLDTSLVEKPEENMTKSIRKISNTPQSLQCLDDLEKPVKITTLSTNFQIIKKNNNKSNIKSPPKSLEKTKPKYNSIKGKVNIPIKKNKLNRKGTLSLNTSVIKKNLSFENKQKPSTFLKNINNNINNPNNNNQVLPEESFYHSKNSDTRLFPNEMTLDFKQKAKLYQKKPRFFEKKALNMKKSPSENSRVKRMKLSFFNFIDKVSRFFEKHWKTEPIVDSLEKNLYPPVRQTSKFSINPTQNIEFTPKNIEVTPKNIPLTPKNFQLTPKSIECPNKLSRVGVNSLSPEWRRDQNAKVFSQSSRNILNLRLSHSQTPRNASHNNINGIETISDDSQEVEVGEETNIDEILMKINVKMKEHDEILTNNYIHYNQKSIRTIIIEEFMIFLENMVSTNYFLYSSCHDLSTFLLKKAAELRKSSYVREIKRMSIGNKSFYEKSPLSKNSLTAKQALNFEMAIFCFKEEELSTFQDYLNHSEFKNLKMVIDEEAEESMFEDAPFIEKLPSVAELYQNHKKGSLSLGDGFYKPKFKSKFLTANSPTNENMTESWVEDDEFLYENNEHMNKKIKDKMFLEYFMDIQKKTGFFLQYVKDGIMAFITRLESKVCNQNFLKEDLKIDPMALNKLEAENEQSKEHFILFSKIFWKNCEKITVLPKIIRFFQKFIFFIKISIFQIFIFFVKNFKLAIFSKNLHFIFFFQNLCNFF